MTTLTKFAVVGAGGIGSEIVDGLLNANVSVTILTRDDTKSELQPFKSRGAVLAKVNYDDEISLKAALIGCEVVVCTVNAAHHITQFAIARAAKAAEVQLFVPTEFGMPDEDGPNIMKQNVRGLLKDLELPSALFFGGLWAEYLPLFVGYNFKELSMNIVGDGNAKMSIVSRSDLSRFMVHVLVTATLSTLEWSQFSVESDRLSPKEIAVLAEKKLGKKMEFKMLDYEETKKDYEINPVSYFLTRIADGRFVSGTEEQAKATVATYFPDWNPTRFEVFIA
ncbi:hypothetical protein PHMEG_00020238 [Phytophthora megakarya]|uniref:NmrA-like domain-containing protein n=1 Tax=Phytophthora megakarya TaxID=4795 RepID=A0A225VR55_9STRA|nr:hypothetical protein PHMEG_00020238 [Phytophthora megakarya]